MGETGWKQGELLSITEAARLLRARVGTRAALYARIRRGTLYAVRVNGHWYVPRTEVRRLRQKPKPRSRLRQEIRIPATSDSVAHNLRASVSLARRGRAALEAQAFLRGTIRARLRRMYPGLSTREITFKYFQVIETDG
jgi:hypothetical protein